MSPTKPTGAQVLTPESTDGTPRTSQTHTVQPGETLAEIAAKYGRHGEASTLWEHNLGKVIDEDGNKFGNFDHAMSGGNPMRGWIIAIPDDWSAPQQPQPAATESDANKLERLLAEVKSLAAKVGQPV